MMEEQKERGRRSYKNSGSFCPGKHHRTLKAKTPPISWLSVPGMGNGGAGHNPEWGRAESAVDEEAVVVLQETFMPRAAGRSPCGIIGGLKVKWRSCSKRPGGSFITESKGARVRRSRGSGPRMPFAGRRSLPTICHPSAPPGTAGYGWEYAQQKGSRWNRASAV